MLAKTIAGLYSLLKNACRDSCWTRLFAQTMLAETLAGLDSLLQRCLLRLVLDSTLCLNAAKAPVPCVCERASSCHDWDASPGVCASYTKPLRESPDDILADLTCQSRLCACAAKGQLQAMPKTEP